MPLCLTLSSLPNSPCSLAIDPFTLLVLSSKCLTLQHHWPTEPFHLPHREPLLVYVYLISPALISFDKQLQNDWNSSPFVLEALKTAWDSISNKQLPDYSPYPDTLTRQEMRVQGNNMSLLFQVGQELQSRTLSSPVTQLHVHLTRTTTPTPQTNQVVNPETTQVTQTHQVTPITQTAETDPLNVDEPDFWLIWKSDTCWNWTSDLLTLHVMLYPLSYSVCQTLKPFQSVKTTTHVVQTCPSMCCRWKLTSPL